MTRYNPNALAKYILLLAASSVFLLAGACCFNKSNVKPDTNLVEHINSSVESWLDIRMDITSWRLFSSNEALWRTSNALELLVENLNKDMTSVTPVKNYWDLTSKINDIKSTYLFKKYPVTDIQLLDLIKDAMLNYKLLE